MGHEIDLKNYEIRTDLVLDTIENNEMNIKTDTYNDGKVKGRAEGENKLLTLFKALENAGRKDDAFKAASDTEYLQKLYEEFGIE